VGIIDKLNADDLQRIARKLFIAEKLNLAVVGPFKREKARVSRVDKTKDEVVVELLEAAVPIPMTLKLDAVKVIRRDTDDEDETEDVD